MSLGVSDDVVSSDHSPVWSLFQLPCYKSSSTESEEEPTIEIGNVVIRPGCAALDRVPGVSAASVCRIVAHTVGFRANQICTLSFHTLATETRSKGNM